MKELITNIVLIIFGSSLTYSGFYLSNLRKKMELMGNKVIAKMSGFLKETNKSFIDEDDRPTYTPIIDFIDLDGKEVSYKLPYAFSFKSKLKEIEILYLKKEKGYEIMINNKLWKFYIPLLAKTLGLILFIVGIVNLTLDVIL